MKKFITSVSQQPGNFEAMLYQPVDGTIGMMEWPVHYPILSVIHDKAKPGDEIRVYALTQDTPACSKNLAILKEELQEICREKQLVCGDVVELSIPYDETITTHIDTFAKLIGIMEDGDELHACITYGSKPMPMIIMMALQYAYRIKQDVTIACVVYGQIRRPEGTPLLYDVTALLQMDEIVRMLAENGTKNPENIIRSIICE